MKSKSVLGSIFAGIWWVINTSRLVVLNLLFLLIVLFVLVLLASTNRHISMPSVAALVVDPQGALVDQLSGDPVDRALANMLGQNRPTQTRLRDVLDAIDKARQDNRIKALVIEPDGMGPAGLASLQAIGGAIKRFKTSGKPVIALGDSYGQAQYYLAAMADKVYLNPQGQILVTGFSIYQNYFKDALDKLAVDWNVFRVGKYKSFVEPYTRNDMSPAAKEANTALLKVLWKAYQQDITRARKLAPDALQQYANGLPGNLAAVHGDTAELALRQKLVTALANRDQMNAVLVKITGENTNTHRFRQIDFRDYLHAVDGVSGPGKGGGNRVSVVIAEGDILPGDRPAGQIGGDSTAALIRKARFDASTKALVLRVDSPGGSAFASDLILREIELTREAGKPVVVSMGDVAASGGYWISMGADRIFAKPTTITGSIGILAMVPTFQKTLGKLGIHTDGVGTTAVAGGLRLDRPLAPAIRQSLQLGIDHGYQVFVDKVAKARQMSPARIDQIAQGRVWSGKDAKRLGLVDELGGLRDAIKAAASLAKLGTRYSVYYVEKPLTFSERLLINLSQDSTALFGPLHLSTGPDLSDLPALQKLYASVQSLVRFRDPNNTYAYCFCNVSL